MQRQASQPVEAILIPLARWERHRSYPEPDGGVIWWDRPVFDRVAFYSMAAAVALLGAWVDTHV